MRPMKPLHNRGARAPIAPLAASSRSRSIGNRQFTSRSGVVEFVPLEALYGTITRFEVLNMAQGLVAVDAALQLLGV